jgi:hypothetical protein
MNCTRGSNSVQAPREHRGNTRPGISGQPRSTKREPRARPVAVEDDGDVHLALKRADGSEMIAEAPEPACTKNSRARASIGKARLVAQTSTSGTRSRLAASGSSTSSTTRTGRPRTSSSCIRCSRSSGSAKEVSCLAGSPTERRACALCRASPPVANGGYHNNDDDDNPKPGHSDPFVGACRLYGELLCTFNAGGLPR